MASDSNHNNMQDSSLGHLPFGLTCDHYYENSDCKGSNDDLREFRDQFIRFAEDLYYTHFRKPEVGRLMKPSTSEFQLDRMKNLFTVG